MSAITDAITQGLVGRFNDNDKAAVEIMLAEARKIRSEVTERKLETIKLVSRQLADERAKDTPDQDVIDAYVGLLAEAKAS